MNSAVKLNIQSIVDAARDAGADAATCQRFAAKLESMERCPEHLVDLDTTMVRKVLSRHWGSVFEMQGEEWTQGDRDKAIGAARAALWNATDLATRISMGQWRIVASELRTFFEVRPRDGEVLTPDQQAYNNELNSLSYLVEGIPGSKITGLREVHPGRTRQFNEFYNAHRVACVLTCRHSECPLHFDCWETRGAFCSMDIEREAKRREASV